MLFHSSFSKFQFKYEDVRAPSKVAVEGCFGMTASERLIALPSPLGGSSCSTLMFVPVDNTKINRLQSMSLVTLQHGSGIADYDFDPFRPNRIVTSGDDCILKLWEIPHDNSVNLKDPLAYLDGESKKITFTQFNNVVDNLLGTASNDGAVSCWDLAKQRQVSTVDCKDSCQSLDWDYFGRLKCGVFKDKALRIIDPRSRTIAQETTKSHQGNKASRAIWLSSRNQSTDSGNFIVSCGFAPGAKREMFLWDIRKIADPVWTNGLDNNSGVIYPFYDECTGLLLLVGKGDGNIRYFEFADSSLYYLNDYRSSTPQRGFCLFPKRVVDQEKSEIVRALKLETSAMHTMSFLVPRRQETGSSDLYPPFPVGVPAVGSVGDWLISREIVPPVTSFENGTFIRNDHCGSSSPMHISPQVDTKGTASTASTPRSTYSRPVAPISLQHEEYKLLKHQLTSANRTIDDQANRISRLEAIVMNLKEPAQSPSPKAKQNRDQMALVDELRSEVCILKEKVVKLMNENARLRMAFSASPRQTNNPPTILATMSALPVPPPPHPVARSPGRPLRPT
jgi:coronin-1B/1C/6